MTDEERQKLLTQQIEAHVRQGWSIESRTDNQAVITKGDKPNHILHLLLSIFTLGLWLIVWLGIIAFGGQKRRVIDVSQI